MTRSALRSASTRAPSAFERWLLMIRIRLSLFGRDRLWGGNIGRTDHGVAGCAVGLDDVAGRRHDRRDQALLRGRTSAPCIDFLSFDGLLAIGIAKLDDHRAQRLSLEIVSCLH